MQLSDSTESRVIRALQPFAQYPLTVDTALLDLGLDSLDLMRAIFAVEEEFDRDIDTASLLFIKTVSDIVTLMHCGRSC